MIDPRISLAAQAPNLESTFSQFQNTLNSVQNRKASQQQIDQNAELFPTQLKAAQNRNTLNEQAIARNEQGVTNERRAQYAKSIADTKPIIDKYIQSGDQAGLVGYLQARKQDLINRDISTETTDEAIQLAMQGDFASIQNGVDTAYNETYGSSQSQLSVGQREFEQLTNGLSTEDAEAARRIKLGLDPRAMGSAPLTIANTGKTDAVASSQSTIEGEKAAARTTKTGISQRKQASIDLGVESSDTFSTITNALGLLKSVKTGGFEAAALRAKTMFGIESADEGELSNALGKSVLSQLKSTFGAAFTEGEGARLERIEAGFGKNNGTNIRLLEKELKSLERKAIRGLKSAKDSGDDFSAQEIQKGLDILKDYRSGGNSPVAATTQSKVQSPPKTATGPNGEKLVLIDNKWVKQ